MEQGKEEEDAINKALIEFGDIKDIKEELGNRQPKNSNKAKLGLEFSICGSLLIIALFVFINYYYTPNAIWFVYPTFAILWWPLSMLYRWLSFK